MKYAINQKTSTQSKNDWQHIPTTWLLHWDGLKTKSDPAKGGAADPKLFFGTKLGL